jgi:hypothetical protein
VPIHAISSLIFAPAFRVKLGEYEFECFGETVKEGCVSKPQGVARVDRLPKAGATTSWLVEHGYRFDVRADGRAVVLTAAIEQKLAGRRTSGAEPDWSAVE